MRYNLVKEATVVAKALRYGSSVLATWDKAIAGDGQIAAHCSEYAGVDISVHQVRRLRQRDYDPLPAEPLNRSERPMWVVRDLNRFVEWLRREYGE